MCIMEVRPGQHAATIAQAMAHNVSTIQRDLEMFKPLLKARGETLTLAKVDVANRYMTEAYELFLEVFASEVTNQVASGDIADDAGSERVSTADEHLISDAMHVAAHDAEKYETR
jgi:hypothetical protein